MITYYNLIVRDMSEAKHGKILRNYGTRHWVAVFLVLIMSYKSLEITSHFKIYQKALSTSPHIFQAYPTVNQQATTFHENH